MMSTAMGPLKSMEWFQTILTHIDDSAWVGVGVGTLLTVLSNLLQRQLRLCKTCMRNMRLIYMVQSQ